MLFWERLPWRTDEFAGLRRTDEHFVPHDQLIEIQYNAYRIVELP